MWKFFATCLSVVVGIPTGTYIGPLLRTGQYVQISAMKNSNVLRLGVVDDEGELWRSEERPHGINATIAYDTELLVVTESSRENLRRFVDAIFYATQIPFTPELVFIDEPQDEFVLGGRLSIGRVPNELKSGLYIGTSEQNNQFSIQVDEGFVTIDVGVARLRFVHKRVGLVKWLLRLDQGIPDNEVGQTALNDFVGIP